MVDCVDCGAEILGGDRCARCQERSERSRRASHLVAVYLVELASGGPEEGGWWYDAGELVRVVKVCRTRSAAEDYAGRFNELLRSRRWGPNQGRRPISSVLSDGEYRAMVFETTAPEFFPERRPHYE